MSASAGGVQSDWTPGAPLVMREILHGKPWSAWTANFVRASAREIVIYIPEGAPWATNKTHTFGAHPREGKAAWTGGGALIVMPRAAPYSIFHFYRGEGGRFSSWYVNFQRPFAPTSIGFDTLDLELDIVVELDLRWALKDSDALAASVASGRCTPAEARALHAIAAAMGAELDRGAPQWDRRWLDWRPDPAWPLPRMPADWIGHPPALPPWP